jgi:geranylgeranyl reductase family protein
MTTCDVIVVGAGPAGATAAKVLGDAGVSTLLLDKSAFPRDKPCGGGISARALNRFPYLNDALAKIPVNWVNKVYFESPSGFAVGYQADGPIYLMIRRSEFDHLLFSIARARVECQPAALVRRISVDSDEVQVVADVEGESKTYHARMVIGCDGANSIVARSSGLRTGSIQNSYAIDMMEETPYQELNLAERDRIFIYYRIRSHYGYGYVFPKTSHINLGVGFKLDYYLSHLRGGHYPHHKTFVDDLTKKQLLTGSSNRGNFRAFPLPISGPLPRTYSDRVLLSGDAGGFVHALTAEGIYYAMVSGEQAGRTAITAVQQNDFRASKLCAYERAWGQEIGVELQKSVSLQKLLLGDPNRIDRIVRFASRSPQLTETLARYATGSLSHSEFKKSLIRRALPLYLAERVRELVHSAGRLLRSDTLPGATGARDILSGQTNRTTKESL